MNRYFFFSLFSIIFIAISELCIAQYTINGSVLFTSSNPVAGQTVYIESDSTVNPQGSPNVKITVMTDSNGNYTATIPSNSINGMSLEVYTKNCDNTWLKNTYTYSSTNITSNFTVCIPVPPTAIEGKITLGTTSNPAIGAKVLLIKDVIVTVGGVSTNILTAIDSAVTNSAGAYSIPCPTSSNDNYLIKSFLLPSHINYSNYLPTYYGNSLMWSDGYSIRPNTPLVANVELQSGVNSGGPGFISGNVLLGANKSTSMGDPLPGRIIILTDDNDNAIGYTQSDVSGQFKFNNLQYGKYKIFGDVMGKDCDELLLNLTNSNNVFVTFEERQQTFHPRLVTLNINTSSQSKYKDILIYPIPVVDVLHIKGLSTEASVSLYNILGKIVFSETILPKKESSINLSTLPSGNYIITITTNEYVHKLTIVKHL